MGRNHRGRFRRPVAPPRKFITDIKTPVLAILRRDALEIVQDDDMASLYEAGYYGKGVVSRRVPNKGAFTVVIPDAAAAGDTAGGIAEVATTGGDELAEVDDGSRKRPREDESLATAAGMPFDTLRTVALQYEASVTSAALPDAFEAAAGVLSHGRDLMPFEAARQIAHYVSAPPPRTQTSGTTGGGAPKLLRDSDLPPGSVLTSVRESSILEAEAAMYALVTAPGTLRIQVLGDDMDYYGAVMGERDEAAGDAPAPFLTAMQGWRIFCATMENFPARYAVYKYFRDRQWIVRDGTPFASDFVLYAKGPGYDHSHSCINVAPLRLIVDDAAQGGAAAAAATAEAPVAADVLVRAPLTRACGSWMDVLAAARVIGTVRKNHFVVHVHAFVPASAVAVPAVAADTDATDMPIEGDAAAEELPRVHAIAAGVDSATHRAGYYPPAIARIFAHPSCVTSFGVQGAGTAAASSSADVATATPGSVSTVRALHMTRWGVTSETVKKASAMLTAVAAAASRAELLTGEHVDLSLYNAGLERARTRGVELTRIKGCIARNAERYVAAAYGLMHALGAGTAAGGADANETGDDSASATATAGKKRPRAHVSKSELRHTLARMLRDSATMQRVEKAQTISSAVIAMESARSGAWIPARPEALDLEGIVARAAVVGVEPPAPISAVPDAVAPRESSLDAVVATLHLGAATAIAAVPVVDEDAARQSRRYQLPVRLWMSAATVTPASCPPFGRSRLPGADDESHGGGEGSTVPSRT